MSSAHAFVGEFDAVGVANETVQDGAGMGRIADVKSDGERLARNQQSANEAIVTSRVAPKFSGRSRHAAPERASVDLAVLVNLI
jgi:hypothetical protein